MTRHYCDPTGRNTGSIEIVDSERFGSCVIGYTGLTADGGCAGREIFERNDPRLLVFMGNAVHQFHAEGWRWYATTRGHVTHLDDPEPLVTATATAAGCGA